MTLQQILAYAPGIGLIVLAIVVVFAASDEGRA